MKKNVIFFMNYIKENINFIFADNINTVLENALIKTALFRKFSVVVGYCGLLKYFQRG